VYVGDSSDEAVTCEAVQKVCEGFEFVRLFRHTGKGISAARNVCVQVATEDLLVTVDDDVYVEPHAILRLVDTYQRGKGWRVVGGNVCWDKDKRDCTGPVVQRYMGYGRKAHPGEPPDYLIGGFFLFPRALALELPWNDRLHTLDDVYIGALWRSRKVALLHEPRAYAFHDGPYRAYGLEQHDDHIYCNLFTALLACPSLPRALSYEILGFAWGAMLYFRRPETAWAYIAAWYRGHRALVRDWSYLNALTQRSLPACKTR
jgi:glycosyltransferase involved in cell wall biosynthesis